MLKRAGLHLYLPELLVEEHSLMQMHVGVKLCVCVCSCQAETRAEFSERSVAKLEKTVDDLEGRPLSPNLSHVHFFSIQKTLIYLFIFCLFAFLLSISFHLFFFFQSLQPLFISLCPHSFCLSVCLSVSVFCIITIPITHNPSLRFLIGSCR